MFNKKKVGASNKRSNEASPTNKIEAPPLKPFSSKGKHAPNKPPVSTSFQPDIIRRKSDLPNSPIRRIDRSIGGVFDNRRLVVGRDIRLKGEITACDKLIVEGHVEITLPEAQNIEITATGFFRGTAEVTEADISGNFEGNLKAHELLIVRSSGRISGTIRYGKIVIESGGEISGDTKNIASDTKNGAEKKSGKVK